jgi:hypothetical protein
MFEVRIQVQYQGDIYLREYAQSEQDQLNATEAHMLGIPIKKGEALEITFPSKLWADIMRHPMDSFEVHRNR